MLPSSEVEAVRRLDVREDGIGVLRRRRVARPRPEDQPVLRLLLDRGDLGRQPLELVLEKRLGLGRELLPKPLLGRSRREFDGRVILDCSEPRDSVLCDGGNDFEPQALQPARNILFCDDFRFHKLTNS